jgi:hypothetical protein
VAATARRRGPGSHYRRLQSVRFLLGRDRRQVLHFLLRPAPGGPGRLARLRLVARYLAVTQAVRGYHSLAEILVVADEILRRPAPTVLEAGAGYGASTAKLSLAVELARGRLVVCDSFQGIPANDEEHRLLDGRPARFRQGAFRGTLTGVRRVVERFGAPAACEWVKGLFADTLRALDHRLDVVVLDVDLVASTRTCLVELFPRVAADGVVLSLDGQLQATHALVRDERFWRREVGVAPPRVEELCRRKVLRLTPAGAGA